MKQIIIVTSDRAKYEASFKNDFYVSWSTFSIPDLIKFRDRSNLILLLVGNEDFETLKTMGLYLRDLCIEDEKLLYLYGPKNNVDIITSLVPSLFIKKALYSHVHFYVMYEELIKNDVNPDRKKPRFLILDDDTEYVESLRPHLDPFFQVFVCRFDINEIASLMHSVDIVLISMDGKMSLYDLMGMLRMLLTRAKSYSAFRYYYLAPTNRERDRMNSGNENNNLTFSKEMEVHRVAAYFTNKFSRPE